MRVTEQTNTHLRATVVGAVETAPRCFLWTLETASAVTPGTRRDYTNLPPAGLYHPLTTQYPTTIIFHGLIIISIAIVIIYVGIYTEN